MEPEKNRSGKNDDDFTSSEYKTEMEKMIRTLTLRAMAAGNEENFESAILNMELALWITQSLEKKCLEAALLNNLGLLYTMQGIWDKAMLTFDRAMEIASVSCTSHDSFLSTLKKNITCLFDPKFASPGDPEGH